MKNVSRNLWFIIITPIAFVAILILLMSCARNELLSGIRYEKEGEKEIKEVWIEYFQWADEARNYVYVTSDGDAQFIRFDPDYKKILQVRSGEFSEETRDALFSVIQQSNFFESRNCVKGELLFYDGILVKVQVKKDDKIFSSFGAVCDFPDQLSETLDLISKEEVEKLQIEETAGSFIMAEIVERSQANSIERRGKYQFISLDDSELEQHQFLKEALNNPGKFIKVPAAQKPSIKEYQEQSQSSNSFFLSLSGGQFFQITEFPMEEKND